MATTITGTSALRNDEGRVLIKGFTGSTKFHAVDVAYNRRTFEHDYQPRSSLCGVRVSVSPTPYTARLASLGNACARCKTAALARYRTIEE